MTIESHKETFKAFSDALEFESTEFHTKLLNFPREWKKAITDFTRPITSIPSKIADLYRHRREIFYAFLIIIKGTRAGLKEAKSLSKEFTEDCYTQDESVREKKLDLMSRLLFDSVEYIRARPLETAQALGGEFYISAIESATFVFPYLAMLPWNELNLEVQPPMEDDPDFAPGVKFRVHLLNDAWLFVTIPLQPEEDCEIQEDEVYVNLFQGKHKTVMSRVLTLDKMLADVGRWVAQNPAKADDRLVG